jgi:Domain of unknown function (DUF4202)
MIDARFSAVIAAIDAANARDPNLIEVGGRQEPAELVYGRRMSATLACMAPEAATHLQIAARGQHIERWRTPRKSYPDGRAGYLKWRNDLKEFHATRLAEIMTAAGYDAEDASRVGALVRKEKLKRDPEAQLLEDVVCVVFLEHYIDGFMAKTDPDKLADILAKTWRKMSEHGHAHALKLQLPPQIPRLLEQGLGRQPARSD